VELKTQDYSISDSPEPDIKTLSFLHVYIIHTLICWFSYLSTWPKILIQVLKWAKKYLIKCSIFLWRYLGVVSKGIKGSKPTCSPQKSRSFFSGVLGATSWCSQSFEERLRHSSHALSHNICTYDSVLQCNAITILLCGHNKNLYMNIFYFQVAVCCFRGNVTVAGWRTKCGI
jgi:hypothetical protein